MPREIRVLFPSTDGHIRLAGTFTMPSEGRATAAVVLVSGTGPIDRDVTFVGHALFRTLAHTLAQNDVASLRFDKRGVGESEGDFSSAKPADFLSDVLGAIEYLSTQLGFRTEETGLLGHSEGGIVALSAAARVPETAFCVLMAGPLLSGRENVVRSFALLAHGSLERDAEFHHYVSDLDSLVEIARSASPSARQAEAERLATRLAPRIFNERTHVILGSKSLSGSEFFSLLSSTCLDTVLNWEPSHVVPLVKCPVLLLYGSKDIQVPAPENISAARALADQLGKSDWAIREVAGMNHAFQRCETGMPDEYASIEYVMAEDVIEDAAMWIRERTRV